MDTETLQILKALKEWRDAREVIFKSPPGVPIDWAVLGKAEHTLMELARKLKD